MAVSAAIARYNGIWTTGAIPALPAARENASAGCKGKYSYNYYVFNGTDSGGTSVNTTYKFNGAAATTDVASATAQRNQQGAAFNNFNYLIGANQASTVVEDGKKYNGVAWAASTPATFVIQYGVAQALANLLVLCSGLSGAANTSACDYSRSYTPAEVAATISPSGNISYQASSGVLNNIFYKISGISGTSAGADLTTAVRTYNGSAWAAGIAIPTAVSTSMSSYTNSFIAVFAGLATTTQLFNGAAWSIGNSYFAALINGQGA